MMLRKVGESWVSLSAFERLEAAQIIGEVKAKGLSLREVWKSYQAGTGRGTASVPLSTAIAETLAVKLATGCRERYVESLRGYYSLFARGREEMLISRLTVEDIRSWFTGRNEVLTTQVSNTGRLSAMFAVALRRGWVTENPTKRLEPIRLERQAPVVLTPRQAAKVLVWTKRHRPQCLAHIALSLLCGIRPEELHSMSWASVDFIDGTAVIDAAGSKVRQRRIVHLDPVSMAWLKLAKALDSQLPISAMSLRRCIRGIRDMLKWEKWPQDLLRHTAASYLLASRQDVGAVAMQLGNSPGILLRHYKQLVTQRDARRFWALIPRERLKPVGRPARAMHLQART